VVVVTVFFLYSYILAHNLRMFPTIPRWILCWRMSAFGFNKN
jgi:hypothetical protein